MRSLSQKPGRRGWVAGLGLITAAVSFSLSSSFGNESTCLADHQLLAMMRMASVQKRSLLRYSYRAESEYHQDSYEGQGLAVILAIDSCNERMNLDALQIELREGLILF